MTSIGPLHQIEGLRESLRWREEAYLHAKGWKHTSNTICCYWLWEREFDGRVYLLGHDHAVMIQKHLDAEKHFELHPEEYKD